MAAPLAAQVLHALHAAGVAVVDVTIGDPANTATWTVQPDSLQAAAQPIIDSFPLTPTPRMVVTGAGRYLGAFEVDPALATDGDTWVLRERFPTQRRLLRLRDGDMTRTLTTLEL